MNISATRFTAPLALAVQWISIAAVMFANKTGVAVLADFGACFPTPTTFALRISQTSVLLPIAVCTTLAVVLTEYFVKSERTRFVAQIVNLSLWLTFTAFVLAALFLPLVKIGHEA